MMNEEQEIELLQNVKSLTDHMRMVDDVFRKASLGIDMVLVFRCGESGLYYPGDYVRNWGRDWGDGLGPHPVSESLQTSYDIAPPEVDRFITSIEQIMHPVRNCSAQVDSLLVERSAYEASMAIPMKGDERMMARAPILYGKQLKNPQSKIARFAGKSITEVMWETKRNGGYR